MCILDDAIENILERFNNNLKSNTQQYEYGWLFWRDCKTKQLLTGQKIDSPNTDSVKLYPAPVRQEILEQQFKIKQKLYVGEFHAHPKSRGTWAGQLPSPQDIVNENISVGGSLWPLRSPVSGVDSVNVSPKFQIIQSLLFGDLIVLERGPAWKPFNSINEQQNELDNIYMEYSKWHRNADLRLNRIGSLNHKSFYQIWSKEANAIGVTIGFRFKVTSIQNNNEDACV